MGGGSDAPAAAAAADAPRPLLLAGLSSGDVVGIGATARGSGVERVAVWRGLSAPVSALGGGAWVTPSGVGGAVVAADDAGALVVWARPPGVGGGGAARGTSGGWAPVYRARVDSDAYVSAVGLTPAMAAGGGGGCGAGAVVGVDVACRLPGRRVVVGLSTGRVELHDPARGVRVADAATNAGPVAVVVPHPTVPGGVLLGGEDGRVTLARVAVGGRAGAGADEGGDDADGGGEAGGGSEGAEADAFSVLLAVRLPAVVVGGAFVDGGADFVLALYDRPLLVGYSCSP